MMKISKIIIKVLTKSIISKIWSGVMSLKSNNLGATIVSSTVKDNQIAIIFLEVNLVKFLPASGFIILSILTIFQYIILLHE